MTKFNASMFAAAVAQLATGKTIEKLGADYASLTGTDPADYVNAYNAYEAVNAVAVSRGRVSALLAKASAPQNAAIMAALQAAREHNAAHGSDTVRVSLILDDETGEVSYTLASGVRPRKVRTPATPGGEVSETSRKSSKEIGEAFAASGGYTLETSAGGYSLNGSLVKRGGLAKALYALGVPELTAELRRWRYREPK